MGTNYYWVRKDDICESCGRGGDEGRFHIGKSSAGWCFNLRIHPDHGINELSDWLHHWDDDAGIILDEYDRVIEVHEMMKVILARWRQLSLPPFDDEWLRHNQAVAGPFGLARPESMPLGKNGPYALNNREFS